jgi:hypothetical protein
MRRKKTDKRNNVEIGDNEAFGEGFEDICERTRFISGSGGVPVHKNEKKNEASELETKLNELLKENHEARL